MSVLRLMLGLAAGTAGTGVARGVGVTCGVSLTCPATASTVAGMTSVGMGPPVTVDVLAGRGVYMLGASVGMPVGPMTGLSLGMVVEPVVSSLGVDPVASLACPIPASTATGMTSAGTGPPVTVEVLAGRGV